MRSERGHILQGETILCFSPSSWFSLWRNRQQIMSRFARQNTVLFVEPQRPSEFSFVENLRKNARNLVRARIQNVDKGLVVIFVPPAIPFGTAILGRRLLAFLVPIIVRLNNAMLIRSVRSILSSMKKRDPILWLYSPFHLGLLGEFGEKLNCYHVYDEIAEYPQSKKIADIIRRYDEKVSRGVDLVFASSRTQAQRRKAFNPDTYFIPNGVDFEHFNRALDPGLPIPSEIEVIPRPIIGFIGLIAFHIDLFLLNYVAETCPDWSLVLIGPIRLGADKLFAKLKSRPNVFCLGERELDALPSYSKAFDVAIMPYDRSTHMMHAYPLKLHEYLAAGRPVVAVSLPELLPFQDVVYLADSQASFVQCVERALKENSNERIQQRVAVARTNTWDQRVEEISQLISSKLGTVI